MRIGFVGLGNLGSKLAGSLLRNGIDLVVRDLDEAVVRSFIERGATSVASPRELAESCDAVITCLPSPAICAEVMEAADGVLAGLSDGKLWLEMSTTDESEVRRLATLASARGAVPIECPVSGGCHRAATGNISIFCGGSREAFDSALPILAMMGRKILHTGPLGSASILKVVTNYLASVNLVSLGEAFAVAQQSGIDLTTAYEAIRISSGTSFVHETEEPSDLERLLRHRLHSRSRAKGHESLHESRRACEPAARSRPCGARNVQRCLHEIRVSCAESASRATL